MASFAYKSCPTFGMHKEMWRKKSTCRMSILAVSTLAFKYLVYFLKTTQDFNLFNQELHQGLALRA